MTQIAHVIVDVPTMQTDQPYSYSIPKELENQLLKGMRVSVPFGRGKRKVQGFVVGIDDDNQFDGELKPIDAIVDLTPALNDELLDLAKYMARQTFAFQITCLYTMLPNVMKSKSKRYLRIIDELDEHTEFEIFKGRDEIEFDPEKMDNRVVSQLLKLKDENKVQMVYSVENRAKVKTVLGIKPALTFEALEEQRQSVRPNAHSQNKLISYLQSIIDTTIRLTDAQQQSELSAQTFTVGEKKGWLTKVPMETYRTPEVTIKEQDASHDEVQLNENQQNAYNQIKAAITDESGQTFLLQGVTGSGKTEVYLRSIAQALAVGKTAIMLVPEISLTPQMVSRVKGRFGDQIAVLHSGLSNGEKYDEWRRINSGEAQVVVGARSAIFAPLQNIGVIIMDEEHETSYKQDETPRYHAREVAKWRAERHHAPLILGSATPSLETRARAEKGVYQRLELPSRINNQPLPEVKIVDMREELKKHTESNFSTELIEQLQQRMDRHEQSILMLNKRGYSSFVLCRDCGFVLQCPNCDISLTLHMDTHTMKCHYCGHEEAIPKICPNCQSSKIRYYGTGTQKVEQELSEKLPAARVLRMDVDTTRRKGMHEKILNSFGNHEADILLGTQMIAKGLDYPDVTLVGVLNADTALGLPDFRASEHTFDLLTQVSGRAGRAEKTGQVYIQTFNPDHYAIKLAKRQDYEDFFQKEMSIRHLGGYPPYYYTIQISVSHEQENMAAKMIYSMTNWLKPQIADECIILGPTPKAIARVNKRYYYQIVIKYKNGQRLNDLLTEIMQRVQSSSRQGYQISIDPDPQHFM